MIELGNKEYFNYLLQRSKASLLYRRYYLYPHISKFLAGRVLDVGCGIGDFLRFRKDTVGIDTNRFNVEYCCENGVEAYLIGNERYPFSDNSFDGVVLDNVLEHMSDPAPALDEIYRVIKSHGNIVVGVPGKRGYISDPDHKISYDEIGLRDCFCNKGFSAQCYMHMPFRSSWMDANLRQYCIYGIFSKS